MWFRLAGIVDGFTLARDELRLNVPTDLPVNVRLHRPAGSELRPWDTQESARFTATVERSLSPALDASIGDERRDLAFEGFPVEPVNLQGEVRAIRTDLANAVARAATTLEWRFGMIGYSPVIVETELTYARDGEHWASISHIWDPWAVRIVPPSWWADSYDEAVAMIEAGTFEPTGHDLLREAWSLQRTNLRASLIVGASAIEVGARECLTRLDPARTQATRDSRSGIRTLLTKDLAAALETRSEFNHLRIANRILDQLYEAAQTRNDFVHHFPGDPRYKEAIARLSAPWLNRYLMTVNGVLWLLDVYAGHAWAESYSLGVVATGTAAPAAETT